MADDQLRHSFGGFQYSAALDDLITANGDPVGLRRQSLAVFPITIHCANSPNNSLHNADCVDLAPITPALLETSERNLHYDEMNRSIVTHTEWAK